MLRVRHVKLGEYNRITFLEALRFSLGVDFGAVAIERPRGYGSLYIVSLYAAAKVKLLNSIGKLKLHK